MTDRTTVALFLLGLAGHAAANGPTAPPAVTVPILVYHQVTDARPPGDAVIAPSRLHEHLDALKQDGFTTITATQLRALIALGRPITPKTVVLTFDAGWKEHLEVAHDLEKRSMVGTFYVLTGFFNDQRYLSIHELQQLSGVPGMEIGSYSHTRFANGEPTSPAPEDVVSEALISKFTIEDLTRRPVTSFAWPFGRAFPWLLPSFAKLGYTSVAGVHPLALNGQSTNVFDLARLNVSGTCTVSDLREMVLLSTYKSCK